MGDVGVKRGRAAEQLVFVSAVGFEREQRLVPGAPVGESGKRAPLGSPVKDAFWDGWKAAAEAEREQLGIASEAELREDSAVKLGLDAIELTFSQLIPQLGEPVAVQRKVEYTLAQGLEWSVSATSTSRRDAPTQASSYRPWSTTRPRPRR